MAFDPLHYRFTQAAIGSPEDDATTPEQAGTVSFQASMVSLMKGMLVQFGTGIVVTGNQTDDTAFTPATDGVMVIGGFADESGPDAVDEGDAGALRMTLQRGLHVNLRNSSGTELSLASGAASAATLRVISATDSPEVTSLAIIDDWDESDRAKVNLIVGQAGIAAGAGAVGATVPRVTHASDDPVTTAVQIMDDWDESDRAKVNPIVGQAGVAAGAGAVGATVQRVTLASDDPLVARWTAGTATLSALASATSSAQLLAANSSRKGVLLHNSDANGVYVKYGTTASSSSYSVLIPASGYWEMPQPIYTGRIDAIWIADGAGSLFVTELT